MQLEKVVVALYVGLFILLTTDILGLEYVGFSHPHAQRSWRLSKGVGKCSRALAFSAAVATALALAYGAQELVRRADAPRHPCCSLQPHRYGTDSSQLALGPTDTLAAYAGPRVSELDVLRTFVALEVPQAVPLDGSISVSDLAAKIAVKDEAAFYKQLRFAYLMGMFRQTEDGKVAHTALSAAIPESEAWISVRLSKLFCQGAFEVATTLRTDDRRGKTTCPCALADPKGLSRTCYDQLEDEPDGRGMERFSKGMIDLFTHHAGGSYLPFIHGFDWSSLGPDATVVDIGGGNGHIEAQIAPLVPGVGFVVQDQPSNEETARQLLADHGLGSRVQFQAHDFFQGQPQLPGGRIPKAYMLLRVLQDWSDADCVRILKPLLPSMEKYGTKLWIMNRILPDELATMPVHKEELLRTLDLLVFTLSGGGERSASDLQRMLGLVDERLKVTRLTDLSTQSFPS